MSLAQAFEALGGPNSHPKGTSGPRFASLDPGKAGFLLGIPHGLATTGSFFQSAHDLLVDHHPCEAVAHLLKLTTCLYATNYRAYRAV